MNSLKRETIKKPNHYLYKLIQPQYSVPVIFYNKVLKMFVNNSTIPIFLSYNNSCCMKNKSTELSNDRNDQCFSSEQYV